MNALLWKRCKMLVREKARGAAYVLSPVFIALWLVYQDASGLAFGASMVFACAALENFVVFSVDDLAFSEAMLASPLTVKKIWVYSAAVNIILTLLPAFLWLTIFAAISGYPGTGEIVIGAISAALLSSALQPLSLVHLSDYSRKRQVIASVAACINIAISALLLFYASSLPEMGTSLLLFSSVGLSIILLAVSFVVFGQGSPEKLLNNTKEFVSVVSDNSKLVVE